jgi:hypothetical protein
MKVLDLFAGLGGFSQGFKDRGHIVATLDNDPKFDCTFTADIKHFYGDGKYDVVLASPPCQEFARCNLPWKKKLLPPDYKPDMSLVLEAKRVIEEINPRYWVLENTMPSLKWITPILGHWVKHVGSRYFWGKFPPFDTRKNACGKAAMWPRKGVDRPALRALIPYAVSRSLCIAIEYDMEMVK